MAGEQIAFPNTWEPGVGGRYPKPMIWALVGPKHERPDGSVRYEYRCFTPEVLRFHRSQARIRIVSAPARTAKSFSTAYDILPECIPEFRMHRGKLRPVAPAPARSTFLVWIVGPDFKTNKEFDYLWTELVLRREQHGIPYRLGRHAYNAKQGDMVIELVWGKDEHGEVVRTLIEGKSASSPESLQGEEIDLWVQSEAADQDGKVWARYGSTRAKRAVFPTTPKLTGAWLKELIDRAGAVSHAPECDATCAPGCEVLSRGIEAFEFSPHCNPDYDWDRFWQEHQSAEARVLGRDVTPRDGHNCFDPSVLCEAMRDPWFAEQFGGRWTYEADRVLPFKWQKFDADDWCHVVDTVPDWLYAARNFVAIDYGWNDPSCVLWCAQGPEGQLALYREIYESRIDPRDLCVRITETSRQYGERVEYYVGDPQKPEVARYLREMGVPVYDRNKGATRDRQAGHMRLVNLLSPVGGKPKLVVLSERAGVGYGCPRAIEEWKKLRRKTGLSSSEFATTALAGHDHAYDCARYLVSSLPQVITQSTWVEREMRALERKHHRAIRNPERFVGAMVGGAPSRVVAYGR